MINIEYFGLVDKNKSPGVYKKIKSIVSVLNCSGYKSQERIFVGSSIGIFQVVKGLLTSKADIVFVRFSEFLFPIIFIPLVLLRVRGKKIIIDVPTPRRVALNELKSKSGKSLKFILRAFVSYFCASWVLMPANIIIQYAEESFWFSLGVKNKITKMGNGILIEQPLSSEKLIVESNSEAPRLKFIAVAQLAEWHGYDRFLRAIAEVLKTNKTLSITFTIVGDGDARQNLIILARELGLTCVKFTGILTGAELDAELNKADIGVSSLGLYRVGLTEAAVLKTREYLAKGLFVVGTGTDPDFCDKHSNSFRYVVSNDDSIDDLVLFINGIVNNHISVPSPLDCFNFANEHLTYQKKLNFLINNVLS